VSSDPAAKPKPALAPPGWDTWKRTYRIEAVLEVVARDFQQLVRHIEERPSTSSKPGCCVQACLAYAVGGLVLMFSAPYLLKRGSWAGDLFSSVGIKTWVFLAVAVLVAIGIHAFRPRPGCVERSRLEPLRTLFERLQNGPLGEGLWQDARWEVELSLVPLLETFPESGRKVSSSRQEKSTTYEQKWLRLRAKGQGGRTIELCLESERLERTVYREKTKSDGRVKFSHSTKEPSFRHVLSASLEASDLRIDLARRAIYACSQKGVSDKDEIREDEGRLRVAWVVRRDDLETSGLRLLKLGEALAAGAP
tara:strand:+ start:214 stop:1137 length:924 start_codon:yes stop_codon:yes gene_type:complete